MNWTKVIAIYSIEMLPEEFLTVVPSDAKATLDVMHLTWITTEMSALPWNLQMTKLDTIFADLQEWHILKEFVCEV